MPRCIALLVTLPGNQTMTCAAVIVYLEFVTTNLFMEALSGTGTLSRAPAHWHACIPSLKLSYYGRLLH
jgi:hypothetical protein